MNEKLKNKLLLTSNFEILARHDRSKHIVIIFDKPQRITNT